MVIFILLVEDFLLYIDSLEFKATKLINVVGFKEIDWRTDELSTEKLGMGNYVK
jgi:hypothetical protein